MSNVFMVWYEGEVEGKTAVMLWGVYAFIKDAQRVQVKIIRDYGYRARITEEVVH